MIESNGLPPSIVEVMKNLPVNPVFISFMLNLVHDDIAAELRTNYRWAQFPENPLEAYEKLVASEITTFLSERNNRNNELKLSAEYVFSDNSPCAVRDDNKYPWMKVDYSLHHELHINWEDDQGQTRAKLIMYPNFPNDQDPKYIFGQYFEYCRDNNGRIVEVIQTPVKEKGKTDGFGGTGEVGHGQQLISLKYMEIQGKMVVVAEARPLEIQSISEIGDEKIAEARTKRVNSKGLIFLPNGKEMVPVISKDGYIVVPDAMLMDVYFDKEGVCVPNQDWIQRYLSEIGINVDLLKKLRSSEIIEYLILPLSFSN
jgi:hypothetical protein